MIKLKLLNCSNTFIVIFFITYIHLAFASSFQNVSTICLKLFLYIKSTC